LSILATTQGLELAHVLKHSFSFLLSFPSSPLCCEALAICGDKIRTYKDSNFELSILNLPHRGYEMELWKWDKIQHNACVTGGREQ
jgi:hypothetical protein